MLEIEHSDFCGAIRGCLVFEPVLGSSGGEDCKQGFWDSAEHDSLLESEFVSAIRVASLLLLVRPWLVIVFASLNFWLLHWSLLGVGAGHVALREEVSKLCDGGFNAGKSSCYYLATFAF